MHTPQPPIMWLISFGSHVVVRREGEASICLPFCVCMCVLMCLCTLNVSRPAGHPSVGLSGVISTHNSFFFFPSHTCELRSTHTAFTDTTWLTSKQKKHRHLTCRHLTHTQNKPLGTIEVPPDTSTLSSSCPAY